MALLWQVKGIKIIIENYIRIRVLRIFKKLKFVSCMNILLYNFIYLVQDFLHDSARHEDDPFCVNIGKDR